MENYKGVISLEGEIWTAIKGYENRYEISNIGRVLSLPKLHSRGGLRPPKILSPGIYRKSGSEYLTVVLFRNKKAATTKIHRLVAQAFIPNPENKPFINHIDNNPSNNKVENLEWCTNQENIRHMHLQGRHVGKSTLSPDDVRYARFLKRKMLNRELADFFKVKPNIIDNLFGGLTYKYIL